METIVNTIDVHIFCDGGCEPNPGEASSGIAIYRQNKIESLHYGLYDKHGTNNTAELNALYQALLIAKQELIKENTVQILSDSQYSIKCISEWAFTWKKNNWTKSSGIIKNLEIIKKAHRLFEELQGKITLSHIKAHAGTEGNELADRMTIVGVNLTSINEGASVIR